MADRVEGKSLSDMEREAEHTRADLIHTVDELHSRVTPRAFKEEVKAYARARSGLAGPLPPAQANRERHPAVLVQCLVMCSRNTAERRRLDSRRL